MKSKNPKRFMQAYKIEILPASSRVKMVSTSILSDLD